MVQFCVPFGVPDRWLSGPHCTMVQHRQDRCTTTEDPLKQPTKTTLFYCTEGWSLPTGLPFPSIPSGLVRASPFSAFNSFFLLRHCLSSFKLCVFARGCSVKAHLGARPSWALLHIKAPKTDSGNPWLPKMPPRLGPKTVPRRPRIRQVSHTST